MNNGVVNYNIWSKWARCMSVEYDAEWSLYRQCSVLTLKKCGAPFSM